MEKRYQVFTSSTYADLQEERHEIIQALLELDCIPAGMELFPAANDDQWSLIKKVINDSDYYIVVIGGRYGTIGPSGKSYTEMEYQYALDNNKPIMGFIHKDPDSLPQNRSEKTERGRKLLFEFRELIKQKMCRFWSTPTELGSQVSRSLVKMIKSSPGVGWVRGDNIADTAAMEEILYLKKQVDLLKAQIETNKTTPPESSLNLAKGDDQFDIVYGYEVSSSNFDYDSTQYRSVIKLEWDYIFYTIAPLMMNEASEHTIKSYLDTMVKEHAESDLRQRKEYKHKIISDIKISDDSYQTIIIQFRSLGMIVKSDKSRSVRDKSIYWTLTPYGDNYMTNIRAIKRRIP